MDPCKSVVEGLHCAKGVQLPSFFWSLFSRIWTEYKDLRSKSLYSLRIQEVTDQKKKSVFGKFSCNDALRCKQIFLKDDNKCQKRLIVVNAKKVT